MPFRFFSRRGDFDLRREILPIGSGRFPLFSVSVFLTHPNSSASSRWRQILRVHGAIPALLVLVAGLPVIYIFGHIFAASRNIAFWDEFDSVLGLVLRFDHGLGWSEYVRQLLALENEHRTVTSRIIITALYGASGTVNFNVISAIGNLCFLGLCAILIASADSLARRIRLGVVLAFGLFQLELYEPFLWSGASIDHFQVLLFAGAAIFALTRPGRTAIVAAGMLAMLATFTLAHGCIVWPLGAVMLWRARRRRALAGWCLLAAMVLGVFFHGFEIHSAHRFGDFSAGSLFRLGQFWLALLGGPLTFGSREFAPLFGLALVSVLTWLLLQRTWTREPVVMPLALFAVCALALVAVGRFTIAGPRIESRYLVLGSLAWSLVAFMLLERWTNAARPFRQLCYYLPVLVAFNVAANVHAAPFAETFLISRDYAAVRFKQFGEEGHAGGFRLHPGAETAKQVLAETARRGIYRLPRFCDLRAVPDAQPNSAMVTYVTDLTATRRTVGFEGWAMIPERLSKRGQIHVVLRSNKSYLVFSTLSIPRPDVAKAFGQPLWRECGYNFVAARARLPAEDFQIGLLIDDGDRTVVKMTEQHLDLSAGF